MQTLYQAGPANVPETLTNPTKSFKKRVTFALISLFLFVVVYLILMVWFGYLSYNLFASVAGGADNSLLKIITGVCLAFLSIFMLKSLFIFNKTEGSFGKELKPEDEPLLFDYLYQLADEASAPRPHRVFLTSRVNASVFYDLSIYNLIVPTKKNLEIGLGLINVLNLGELKAVLAHEFGHFAQRSMLLGRYVYTAQQVAVQVINKRDALDSIIAGLSRIDIRIAWVGWILSILVWAIRSLIHTLFSVVAMAEKALSREMEFQADLVAVSITGSDALIHALHKLKIADEAYHVALDTVNEQLNEKRAVQDLFTLQRNHIVKMAWVTDNPNYGQSPVNVSKDGNFRVFNSGVVNPPEMWSTHPADNDREENAKRTYIYADIDERSSWELFKDSEKLRNEVTAELIETAKVETTALAADEGVAIMNKRNYEWSFLDPKYRGVYLERFGMLDYSSVEEAYSIELDDSLENIYRSLYPESLKEILENHKELEEEIQTLTMISHEVLTAEKRVIVHRGNRIKRSEIPDILQKLKKEEEELRARLVEHDKKCRKVNQEAAGQLNNSKVKDYLKNLAHLVHYAEHSIADLNDMNGKFNNTLQVILADGKVSSSEMTLLMEDCNEIHKILNRVFSQKNDLKLDDALVQKLGKPYSELLEDFTLGLANQEIIDRWVNSISGWVASAQQGLQKLRNASLERLLLVEDEVKEAFLTKKPLLTECGEIMVPEKYDTLIKGNERKLKFKLGFWDRFHANDGIVPTIVKFAVSAAIIIAALYFGSINYKSDLYIYNGLATKVQVHFNGEVIDLKPHDYETTTLAFGEENEILALTMNGDTIEEFKAKMRNRSSYVYNIARAGFAVEYTVSYGYETDRPDNYLGTLKWFSSDADFILKDPPSQIRTSSSGRATRTALEIVSDVNPYNLLSLLEDEEKKREMVMSHVMWDDENADHVMSWLEIAAEYDPSMNFLSGRLENKPFEVISWRTLQNHAKGSRKDSLCRVVSELQAENTESGDLYYLNIRCMEDGEEQDNLFIEGSEKWPENGWLSFASGYIYGYRGEWEKAYSSYAETVNNLPNFLSAISIDFERIHRYMEAEGKSESYWDKALANSPYVSYLRQLESGLVTEGQKDVSTAFYYLHNGDINQAVSYVSSFEGESKNFDWFAAASTNASSALKNIVLSYDTSALSYTSVWVAAALKAKYNKDYLPFTDRIGYLMQDEELDITYTNEFLKAVVNRDIGLANEKLKEFGRFNYQVLHQMMGLIILEDKAPESWKKNVDRLLFINEKPYFAFLNETEA